MFSGWHEVPRLGTFIVTTEVLSMKLFVPGRVCLFGEHSDWAGGYRRVNAELERGYTVITGTNQGLYAQVKPHPSKLIFSSTLPDGTRQGPFEVPMERSALMEVAERGDFFSYAAGVAYQVATHYRVRGLQIDNDQTTLPVKKGLSSSAAVCVLVARAFNRVYDLKMTTRGEMEYAYQGEITTPSRCGRMDQGCAYGSRPILMTYDGDRIDVREMKVPTDLHLVVVDLHAAKDTRQILADLNRAFPFADDALQKQVQQYLGPINRRLVLEAVEAIEGGDAARVGALMVEAQAEFDRHLQAACPSELTAPVLHKVLAHEPVQPLIHGAKGVGSQGDGTAQFLAKGPEQQKQVIEILERDLGVSCLELVIRSGRSVRKAVIPAAGFGQAMFPASKAMKKELFPVIDASGRAKPVILAVVEEAIRAGLEEVCLIVQPADVAMLEALFNAPPLIEHFNKLSDADRAYSEQLLEIGRQVRLVVQDKQEGFGHAVHCARRFVGDEPFLLLLGAHLYASDTSTCCARQLLDVYERVGHSVVGLKLKPADQLGRYGCVTGTWTHYPTEMSVTAVVEKPDVEYARDHLRPEGLAEDQYLTVFGQYVLEPTIFEYLGEMIDHNLREGGDFAFTPALDKLRQYEQLTGHIVQGRQFDIGDPDAYRRTVAEYAAADRSMIAASRV